MSKLSELLPDGPEKKYIADTFGEDADAQTVAKALMETRATLSKSTRVPPKDAPESDWDKFFGTLGRPATAADYKLPETTNGMKPVLESLRDVAWKRGLTQDQFEALASEAASVSNQANQKTAQARRDWEQKLRESLGDKADKRLQDVDASLKNLLKDDPEAMAIVQESGLDKHPAIANLLMRVRDALGDDNAPLGASPAGKVGPTGSQVMEQIQTILGSDDFKSSGPRQKLANDLLTSKLMELRSLGYSGPGDPRLQPERKITLADGTVIPVPKEFQ